MKSDFVCKHKCIMGMRTFCCVCFVDLILEKKEDLCYPELIDMKYDFNSKNPNQMLFLLSIDLFIKENL